LKGLNGAYAFDVATLQVEPEALRKIPRSLALDYDILSVASDGNQLTVVVPDPKEPGTVDKIRFTTGMHVHALEASRSAIRARLRRIYGEIEASAPAKPQLPAAAAANDILADAARLGASDVHIEPVAGGGGRVRRRVDGILHHARTLDRDLYAHIVSRVKLLAGMDIADRRQPQDGRYDIEIGGRAFEARVSSMPTIDGEKLAIRLLADHALTPSVEQLDVPPEQVAPFRLACRAPHGFIVAAGPTGSGKTTTLYAIMNQRDPLTENVCSVEDPVEVRLPGASQVQINARAGVTFASALRAFLRQDPNVIMVGEMRDRETAAVAASASLSGQLVLTSLHSNDAPSAVERLIELGVHRRTISAGLTAIVAQRLVRTLCSNCKAPSAVDREAAGEFRIAEGTNVFERGSCAACVQTGYVGRAALFEFLFVNDAIREAVAAGVTTVELTALAGQSGYQPMFAHGVRRVLAGQTSLDELRRVLPVSRA
jgi:type IV pilus assembly protein PilB